MSRLLGGAAANLVTIVTGVVSGLVLTVACTRAWEPARYGAYAFSSQLATTLALLSASAFPVLALRLVAAALAAGASGQARRVAFRIVFAALGSALAFLLAFAVLEGSQGILPPESSLAPVLALALAQVMATVLALATQGAGRFDRVAMASLPAVGGAALVAAWLATGGHGTGTVLYVIAAGQGLLALVLALRLPRDLPPGPDPEGPTGRDLAGYFLPAAAVVVIDLVVWQKSEVFFLGHYRSAEEIALYAAAFAMASAIARSAPMALGGVLTPAFAGFAGRDARADAAPLFARAVAGMAALSCLLALAGWAIAPSLLGLLRPSYLAALPLIPLLLAGFASGNISGTASTVFHGFGRADALLRMGLVLAAANIALDFALIPRFGATGAAIACGVAQFLALPLAAVLLRRVAGFRFPWPALLRILVPTLAGIPVVLTLRALAPGGGLLVDAITAGIATSLAALVWIRLGGPADLRARALVTDPPPPSGPLPEVSIVIPTKNRPDYVLRAVRQVLAQEGPAREIIVIDSSDDELSQQILQQHADAVRRVRVRGMPHNRHFAKNQGIRLARAPILLFLDDDSFAEPGWLQRAVALYRDPAVGGGGGRIIDEVFGTQPAGAVVGGIEPNGRIHLNFTRHTGAVIDVEHVIGCNMSFRAEALRRAGGFDLAYGGPNLMEETDLCLRVRRLGYRIRWDPDAVVYHANAPRDAGFKREMLDARLEFWSARSRAYFALKLLPRSIAVLRHNALGALKQHLELALERRSGLHLRAFALQAAGLAIGAIDWLLWRCPRVPPEENRGAGPGR